jgi:hypothetical protein
MNNIWVNHIVRFILYIALQVLVLKHINLAGSNQNYIFIMIYPVALLTLPIKIPQFFVILIAFTIGFIVDLFYVSPGVHAGACLWMVIFRPLVLRIFEPKNGYHTDISPTISNLGVVWFSKYASVLLFIFFLSYFILEIFTFVYAGEILVKTILSFFVSSIIIFLVQLFYSFKS